MAAPASHIPLAYRLAFLYLDPLATIGTSLALLIKPNAVLSGMSPRLGHDIARFDRNIAYDPVMWHLFGFFILIAVLQGGLCRYTADVNVWKLINLGILAVDLSILWGMAEATAIVGNAYGEFEEILPMRVDDWIALGFTVFVAAVRIFFITGVGLGKGKNKMN